MFFAFGQEICLDFEEVKDAPKFLAELVTQILEELDVRTLNKNINPTTASARVMDNYLGNRRRQVGTQSGLAIIFNSNSGMTNQDTSELAHNIAGNNNNNNEFNVTVNNTECTCDLAIASSETFTPSISPSISPSGSPSISPTISNPTTTPSISPTASPSMSPTKPDITCVNYRWDSIGMALTVPSDGGGYSSGYSTK